MQPNINLEIRIYETRGEWDTGITGKACSRVGLSYTTVTELVELQYLHLQKVPKRKSELNSES